MPKYGHKQRSKLYPRESQGRNEVLWDQGSGIKGLKRVGIRDCNPGIWNHNVWDWEQQYFSWNKGSGSKFLQVQGSKFSSFWDQGSKFLGKNMGSVTKKYTLLLYS